MKSTLEIWRDIKDYEGLYQVSSLGRVKNKKRNTILKNTNHNNGYLIVRLCKNSKYKVALIHRLVAEAFIPNPDNLPQINHKDENKTNNNINNLEWCSISYNQNYGTASKRKSEKLGKKILQYTIDGQLINEYVSINEASKQNNLDRRNISGCCRNKYGCKTAGGYIWKYKLNA